MKRKFLLLTVILIVLCIPVAATPSVNIDDELVTISGNTEGNIPYENVTLRVMFPEKTLPENFSWNEIKNSVLFIMQKNSDENGNYVFDINMKECEMGRYKYCVSEGKNKTESEFAYATHKQKSDKIKLVNEKTSGAEIALVFDIKSPDGDMAYIFNITNPLVFEVDNGKLLDIFYNLNKDNKIVPENTDELTDKITLSAVLEALNEGINFNIGDYSNILQINNEFMETYNSKMLYEEKAKFTEGFSGNGISSLTAFNSLFNDKVILSVLNNIQNWNDTSYIIEKHGSYMGIDVEKFSASTGKNSLAAELGKYAPYITVSQFTDKYKELYPKYAVSKPQTGISSPVGGGGGGGTFPKDYKDEPVNTEEFKNNTLSPFKDLDNVLWAKEYIDKLYSEKIISGTSADMFSPDREIKREEFIKLLVLAFSPEEIKKGSVFTDSDSGDWFYDYVIKAANAGLIKGYSDGSFGAGKNITREETAVLSYRAATARGVKFESADEEFADSDEIADYAKEAVSFLRNAEIISGIGGNYFNPKSSLTRAQAAKIICLIKEAGGSR